MSSSAATQDRITCAFPGRRWCEPVCFGPVSIPGCGGHRCYGSRRRGRAEPRGGRCRAHSTVVVTAGVVILIATLLVAGVAVSWSRSAGNGGKAAPKDLRPKDAAKQPTPQRPDPGWTLATYGGSSWPLIPSQLLAPDSRRSRTGPPGPARHGLARAARGATAMPTGSTRPLGWPKQPTMRPKRGQMTTKTSRTRND